MLVRIGLLTEGGYPYVSGDARLWCDRLVRGLGGHEFDIYALSRSERQEDEGWIELPPQVSRVRTAPLWTAEDDGVIYGRRARRRFAGGLRRPGRRPCAADPTRATRRTDRPRPPLRRTVSAARCTGSPNSPGTRAAWSERSAPKPPYAHWSAPVARPAHRGRRARRASRTCSPSPHNWNAPCAPSRSTGTRTTGSARSTSAMPPPAARRHSPDCSPTTSPTSPCWSPSTASRCGRTTWPRAPTTAPRPHGPCSRPSTAGWPRRSTGGPRSSPPATRTPAAGRRDAGPTGRSCGPCTPAWTPPTSRKWASRRRPRTPTRWSGSAASSPPRT